MYWYCLLYCTSSSRVVPVMTQQSYRYYHRTFQVLCTYVDIVQNNTGIVSKIKNMHYLGFQNNGLDGNPRAMLKSPMQNGENEHMCNGTGCAPRNGPILGRQKFFQHSDMKKSINEKSKTYKSLFSVLTNFSMFYIFHLHHFQP